MKEIFVNFSNHRIQNWGEKQIESSKDLVHGGELVDVPFPQVDPYDTEKDLIETADVCVREILKNNPSVVMCQGEFGLSYLVINQLKKAGIKVVYACSERKTKEVFDQDGTSKKVAIFEFVNYREYSKGE